MGKLGRGLSNFVQCLNKSVHRLRMALLAIARAKNGLRRGGDQAKQAQ